MFQVSIKLLFSELFISEGAVVKSKVVLPDGIFHAFVLVFFYILVLNKHPYK